LLDDELELAARRRAAALRDAGTISRHPSGIAVGVNEPAVPGARAFTLEAVAAGWVLYSKWEPLDAAGIVVEVIHRQHSDTATGEIWAQTSYYLYNYWRGGNPWRYLDAADVDLAQLAGLDRSTASTAVRQLIKPLVLRKRRHQLTATEIETVRHASILARAVAL